MADGKKKTGKSLEEFSELAGGCCTLRSVVHGHISFLGNRYTCDEMKNKEGEMLPIFPVLKKNKLESVATHIDENFIELWPEIHEEAPCRMSLRELLSMPTREETIQGVTEVLKPYLGIDKNGYGERELVDVFECVGKLLLPFCHVKVELTQIRIN